jgi:hypothetical protein
MDSQIIVQHIVRECTDINGFLVKLHSYNTFDGEKFKILIDYLSRYQSILGDQPEMSRSVAGCLLALQQEIDNQIDLNSQRRKSDKKAEEIALAYEELWQLINDIMKI